MSCKQSNCAGMIDALCAFQKNKIKPIKQEKTMMVLFCFIGFILFFISPLAEELLRLFGLQSFHGPAHATNPQAGGIVLVEEFATEQLYLSELGSGQFG